MLCWRGPMLKGPVILQSRIEIKNEKELNETSTCPVWGSFSVTLIARKFATCAVFWWPEKKTFINSLSFSRASLHFGTIFCSIVVLPAWAEFLSPPPNTESPECLQFNCGNKLLRIFLQPARCRGGRIRSLFSTCLLGSPLLCRVLGTLRVTTLVWWWWREQKSLEKAIQSF